MNDAPVKSSMQEIIVDEVFPHTPETIWKILTSGELMNRWLMPQEGFAPVKGNQFTLQTKPDGDWDGVIRCQVLEITPNERLVHTWKSGHQSNAGYVSRLDTIVAWTLMRNDGGTRLRLVHSGFAMPKNVSVFQNISEGWPKVIRKMIVIAAEEAGAAEGKKPMTEAYAGGCACGAIRYEISGEPIFSNDCQCRDCQRKSGTGHGSYLTFLGKGSVKLEGDAKRWDIVGDSGNVKTRAFCPTCGSPVYMTFAAMPDAFTVHAGSLDDPSRYKPQAVTYGVRGYAWDHTDPALPKFDKMPPT